jgi:hypothetical protein
MLGLDPKSNEYHIMLELLKFKGFFNETQKGMRPEIQFKLDEK